MPADVLYITFDGALQPLAFSQVVRVVAGLGGRGLRYHLVSIERPADMDKVGLRPLVDHTLVSAGVAWTPLGMASMGSARLAIQAAAQVTFEAARIARREGIKLVHARGYHGALVARALKRTLGLPYIFDARGYWIEERSGPGGWFATAPSYALGKFMEQVLFRGAAAVVTLTELQATDISAGLFGPPPALLEVIPTCADYDVFSPRDTHPAKTGAGGPVPEAVQSRLAGKRVLGIVGALNDSYFVKETLTLAKLATQISSTTHLLVLSRQHREYESLLQSTGIPPDRYTVASAEHWDMPEWLRWIDWGLLLLPETAAKRASMPTKLAEFFAAGVRPVFYGCNSEATRWVERAGSGCVLPSVEPNALAHAARSIADSAADPARLQAAREITMPHFGLTSCLDRYAKLVAVCLSRPLRAPLDGPKVQRYNGTRLRSSEAAPLSAAGRAPPAIGVPTHPGDERGP